VKSYRGFSGEKRAEVQRWLNAEFKAGRLTRPSKCAACGQSAGIVDSHCEDYDKPAEFVGLCVRCHLSLHCRFRDREAWEWYRVAVSRGAVFEPLHSRALGPIAQMLKLRVVPRYGPQRGHTYLDTITDGPTDDEARPRAGWRQLPL
jgi:hypothetical protein